MLFTLGAKGLPYTRWTRQAGLVDNRPSTNLLHHFVQKNIFLKSRIWETKHLSTDADSSYDTTVGWTKNTPKTQFCWKTEKIIQNAKTQKHLELCKN